MIEPAVQVLYARLIYYAERPELPGSQWFAADAGDVEQRVMEMVEVTPLGPRLRPAQKEAVTS